MLKKVLSVLFAAALCVVATAGVSAQADNGVNLPKDCPWIYFDSQWNNNKITALNGGEGVPEGTCPALDQIYALRVTVSCAEAPSNVAFVNNGEAEGWSPVDVTFDAAGDNYVTTYSNATGTLFKTTDSYAQICIQNNGGPEFTIIGAEWLDKDGNVLQSYGKSGSLPKTGVLSAAVFYGLGSLLIGGGVVATKKARKED